MRTLGNILLCGVLASGWGFAEDRFEVPELPAAMWERCLVCHDSLSAEGGFDLESLEFETVDILKLDRTLRKVHQAIVHEEMPPPEEEPPTSVEREEMLAWIDHLAARMSEAQRGDPGPVVMPQLTLRQHEAAIRDLTGLKLDLGPYLPRQGGAGEGFLNVGAAHSFSKGQFQKYLQAADEVLAHLRASPVVGLEWTNDRPVETVAPIDRREELFTALRAWYGGEEDRLFDEHRAEMEAAFGNPFYPYFEAAWSYRHRAALGEPDATFDSIAVERDPPLHPEVLQSWYRWLTAEADAHVVPPVGAPPTEERTFPPFAIAGFEAWRALPAPDEASADEIERRLRSLGEWWSAVDVHRSDGFEPTFSWSRDGKKKWSDWPGEKGLSGKDAKSGKGTIEIEVDGKETVYLVTTDVTETSPTDVAIWSDGRFQMGDGSTVPWKREGPLRLVAPLTEMIAVPAGAKRFTVRVGLDPEVADEDTGIQVLALTRPPFPEWTRYIPGRPILEGEGHPRFNPRQNLRTEFLLRNRVLFDFTRDGLRAERNYLADLTDRVDDRDLGGPWPEQFPDGDIPPLPLWFTAGMLRDHASEESLVELRAIQDRLVAEINAPWQRVARFLRERGYPEIEEGVIPEDFSADSLEASERRRWESLLASAHEHERKLKKRAAELFRPFVRRAWRGPVTEDEIGLLVDLFRQARRRGASFDLAMKDGLRFVLASPRFLFRRHSGEEEKLNDHELASRLSFVLWGSIPDEELLSAAERGDLSTPEELAQQARRMLDDPKARGFAVDFLAQWFHLADFGDFDRPDPDRFPEFTPGLREDMMNEATAFFLHVLRSDAPVTDLLAADYTFVNERLADHYGLASIEGDEFRRVEVDSDRRGGVAGLGAVLTATSAPLRTSPVLRGVWVLEQVLGAHLPAPPPDVDPLSDDETNLSGEPIAVQLAKHRESAACARCHDRIDPIGLSLENFDPIGRWRETDRTGAPVITEAVFPNGSSGDGLPALKSYLHDQSDRFTELFCRKLLGYLLGRPVQPGDAELLGRMHRELETSDFRFFSALEPVLASRQFLERRPIEPES